MEGLRAHTLRSVPEGHTAAAAAAARGPATQSPDPNRITCGSYQAGWGVDAADQSRGHGTQHTELDAGGGGVGEEDDLDPEYAAACLAAVEQWDAAQGLVGNQ